MTNLEILNFNELYKQNFQEFDELLPAKILFYVYKNLSLIEISLHHIENTRNSIIRKYGLINESKETIQIPPELVNEANKELEEVLKMEQEINFSLIPLSWFDNINLNPKHMKLLWIMIDENK